MAYAFKIRGKNAKEKTASIEHALRSLARKATRRATIYIPPVPIFIQCDEVGETNLVGKALIPFNGIIKNLYIHIGYMKTKSARLWLTITTANTETTEHFMIHKQAELIVMETSVNAGSVIQVGLEEGHISDILIGTAIYPHIEDHKAKQYLLEDILSQEREEEDAVQDEKE